MTVAELAWAAGLFEGEGSVRINSRTKRNLGALLVDVPNVDPAIPAYFLARWGGTVSEYSAKGSRRGYFRWRCASTQAAAFLRDVLPYLVTAKYRDRALLGLEYQSQKRRGHENRSAPYAERQHDFYERMAALNLRGRAA